jgi:hypothetical protein
MTAGSRSTSSEARRPAIAAPRRIFIHSAAVSTPAGGEIEGYCWRDVAVPSLVAVDTVLAEIPPEAEVSADLVREIQFASDAGTQVVWLITTHSSAETLATLLGVGPFALHSDGPRASLEVTDPRFDEYFANIDSYHFVFPLPQGFDSVAVVTGSPVAVAAMRTAPPAACVAYLPFPAPPSGKAVTSLLDAFARIRAAAAARQDPWRAIWRGVLAFALLVGLVAGLRYYYLHRNHLINDILAAGTFATPLGNKPNGFILSQLHDIDEQEKETGGFRDILSLRPDQVVRQANLDSLLALYTSLGIERLEPPTVSLLQEQQQHAPAGKLNAADQHLRAYASGVFRSLRIDLMNGDYQAARLQAHKFLAIVYSLHDPGAKAYQSLALRKAHAVIDMVKDRYIYHDHEFVDFFVAGDNHSSDDPRPDAPGDPSLRDDADYFDCAFDTRELRWPEEPECWRNFIQSFPGSARRQEAEFNLVRSHFYGALRVRATEPGEVALAIHDCDDFVRRYPASYLSDDAMLYGLVLASVGSDAKDLWPRYLALASSGGDGPDSYDRLLVRLSNMILERCSPSTAALQSLLRASVNVPERSVSWFASAQLGKDLSESLRDLMRFLTTAVPKSSPQGEDLSLRTATLAALKIGLQHWIGKEVDKVQGTDQVAP